MQKNKRPIQYSPRRFPKKQYRRLSYRFWAIVIGIIIIILIVGGILFKVLINNKTVQPQRRIRSVKIYRYPVRKRHHQSPAVQVTPKRGEQILGHWLIKLHYPQRSTQIVLKNYERINQIKEKQLTQRLIRFNHDRNVTKIQQLIKDNLK